MFTSLGARTITFADLGVTQYAERRHRPEPVPEAPARDVLGDFQASSLHLALNLNGGGNGNVHQGRVNREASGQNRGVVTEHVPHVLSGVRCVQREQDGDGLGGLADGQYAPAPESIALRVALTSSMVSQQPR